MDCGHEMPGMSTCSLSCCHHADQFAMAPVLFVLPPAITVGAFLDLKSAIRFFSPVDDSRSTEPLSPPPRLFATAV